MIGIIYNDKQLQVEDSCSLASLLQEQGIDEQTPGIAVAHRLSVIPQDQWKQVLLEEGDHIHVLHAIQGG